MSRERSASRRDGLGAAARAPAGRLERRREELIRVGVELFGSRSYEAVSIEDLARAAGISTGLLYRYFPSKRAFYVATVRAAAAALLERTAPDRSLPQAERLGRSLEAYLDYVDEHAQSYAGLLRGGLAGDSEIQRIVESTREAFVRRTLEEIGIGRPSPRLRLAVRGWVGFAEAVVLSWIGAREIGRRQVARLLLVAARGLLGELRVRAPGLATAAPARGSAARRGPGARRGRRS